MARSRVLPIKNLEIEVDVYSNKSSMLLFWLLAQADLMQNEGFSVNEAAREIGTSVGLVHKIVKQLEFDGLIMSKGLRTNKKFYLKKPEKILSSWIVHYNLIRKAKNKGFSSSSLLDSKIDKLGLVPALHTASENIFHLKSTNLRLKEYYLLDWEKLPKIVEQLHLQEMDRGYEILLIKPYYSALLEKFNTDKDNPIWQKAYLILTILDLCHFPIRGIEQASTLYRKSDLKSFCPWSEIERAIR